MIGNEELFHVHTFRCRHAENIPDRDYIEKAVALGAKGIWFTDHAPFPGDPFNRAHRMVCEELPDYLNTLSVLKDEYRDRIEVHIGLETEYFPKFDARGYYDELKNIPEIEILLLGQHMAELPEGGYSYDWDREKRGESEYAVLGEAIVSGILSGYFDIVAHPDRIFRLRRVWDKDMEQIAEKIISAAEKMNIPLEQNESSKAEKYLYWDEFWKLADGRIKTVRGLDAHSLAELVLLK